MKEVWKLIDLCPADLIYTSLFNEKNNIGWAELRMNKFSNKRRAFLRNYQGQQLKITLTEVKSELNFNKDLYFKDFSFLRESYIFYSNFTPNNSYFGKISGNKNYLINEITQWGRAQNKMEELDLLHLRVMTKKLTEVVLLKGLSKFPYHFGIIEGVIFL